MFVFASNGPSHQLHQYGPGIQSMILFLLLLLLMWVHCHHFWTECIVVVVALSFVVITIVAPRIRQTLHVMMYH